MLLRLVIALVLLVAGCIDAPADKLRNSSQDRAQAAEALWSKTGGARHRPAAVMTHENPLLANHTINNISYGQYAPAALQSRPNAGSTNSNPAWRQGMTPLTWYEVGANVVTDVDPRKDPSINPNFPAPAPWDISGPLSNMAQEWSGGAWDETRQTFWIFGGGHDGYQGNEGFSINLDADSPTWQRRGYPTGSFQRPGTVRTRNGAGWGSDGRPLAVHTYNLLTVLGNGRVFQGYGNGAYDSGPPGPSAFEFDPATNDYDMSRLYTANYPYIPPFGSCEYDGTRNTVWCTAGPRLISYDIAARTGTILYGELYGPEFGSGRLIRMPEHDLLVKISGSANSANTGRSVVVIDPANPTHAPIGIRAATNPVWALYGVAYDTRRKRFMGWPGGAAIETLTPPASNPKTGIWTYSSLAISTALVTPTKRNREGTYGRFFYSYKYDCAVAYNKTTEKLFVLPLS